MVRAKPHNHTGKMADIGHIGHIGHTHKSTFEEEWFERVIWSVEKWFVLSHTATQSK